MPNRTEKNRKKKVILITLLFIAIVASIFTIVFNFKKVLAVGEGWGVGIWNNYIAGHAENDPKDPPAIGWLKSSSDLKGPCFVGGNYSIVFSSGNPGDEERFVSGKAWFGIGSEADTDGDCQNDLPSLGWFDFGAGAPSFCSGQGDCHAARWHSTSDDNYTGYLDGYAQVTSMGNNGWVRLRDPNSDPKKYAVSVDSGGYLSGFSWNSGLENTREGNSGLGWIKMDGLKIEECRLGCATKELCGSNVFSSCDSSSFCTGSGVACSLTSGTTWTCSNSCGSIDCEVIPTIPEYGQCGELNNGHICDRDSQPVPEKLCEEGTPSTVSYSAFTAKWTCGNNCGEKVECSAGTSCGWIETNH